MTTSTASTATVNTGIRFGRLVIGAVILPLSLGAALWFASAHGWWLRPVQTLEASTVPRHVAQVRDCDERQPLGSTHLERCTWNKDSGGKPIYLVGDSNAGHFSEGIIQAGAELDRPVLIATAYSCPFVDVVLRDTDPARDNEACHRYVEKSLQYLSHAEAGLVVISNVSDYWLSESYAVGETEQKLSTDPHRKIGEFRSGLLRTVEELRSAGHQVLLIQSAPTWGAWDPSRCTLPVIFRGQCVEERSLEQAVAATTAVRAVQADIAKDANVAIFDSTIPLCPDRTCSTEAPSFTRYKDRGHISVPQSMALAGEFRRAIVAASDESG